MDTRGLAVEALHPAAAEPHPAIRLSGGPGPDLLTNQQFSRLRTQMCFKSKILNCDLYYLFCFSYFGRTEIWFNIRCFSFTSGIPPLSTVYPETNFILLFSNYSTLHKKCSKIASRNLNLDMTLIWL